VHPAPTEKIDDIFAVYPPNGLDAIASEAPNPEVLVPAVHVIRPDVHLECLKGPNRSGPPGLASSRPGCTMGLVPPVTTDAWIPRTRSHVSGVLRGRSRRILADNRLALSPPPGDPDAEEHLVTRQRLSPWT
jgi:hypothetical protein